MSLIKHIRSGCDVETLGADLGPRGMEHKREMLVSGTEKERATGASE